MDGKKRPNIIFHGRVVEKYLRSVGLMKRGYGSESRTGHCLPILTLDLSYWTIHHYILKDPSSFVDLTGNFLLYTSIVFSHPYSSRPVLPCQRRLCTSVFSHIRHVLFNGNFLTLRKNVQPLT